MPRRAARAPRVRQLRVDAAVDRGRRGGGAGELDERVRGGHAAAEVRGGGVDGGAGPDDDVWGAEGGGGAPGAAEFEGWDGVLMDAVGLLMPLILYFID